MLSGIAKDIRERAGVLIEQWSNGKFYVIKHRWSDDYKHNREIHPNEIFKLMATVPDVVVVNGSSLTPDIPRWWSNPCNEITQPWDVEVIEE